MKRAMRILPVLLPLVAMPLGAAPPEEGVRTFPQPVLLDWGDQYRLNSPPKNGAESSLKRNAAGETPAKHPAGATPPSRATATLGPEDPAKARLSSRPIASDDNRLIVEAPVKAGPVSLGASYGRYRAVPTSTREVSAHDMRVSLGLAF